MLKKSLLLMAIAGSALPAVSFAEDASPLSFNIGAVTDYRYRGISQTRLKPALQGGLDYAAPKGFYVGTWASTIQWIKDAGGDAKVEIDVYGGWKGEVAKGLTLDVGVLQYVYPSAKTSVWSASYADPNTTELYGALTAGPATLKYSHAVTNTFGNLDSKNSYYVDLSASFEVGGVTLVPHVGYQKITGPSTGQASYTDYSFAVSKDFSGLTFSATAIGTDADKSFYVAKGKELGKPTLVLGVKKTF